LADNILFHESGSGEPFFLIHGLALDHSIWFPVKEVMSKYFRIILPDIRSHGLSTIEKTEFSMIDLGRDIIQIMDRMDIETAYFAGHSMGGYISLSILKNFPQRIRGIALVTSHIYADTEEKCEQRLFMAERLSLEEPIEVFRGMPDKLTKDEKIADYCRKLISQTDGSGIGGVLRAMAHRPSYEGVWKSTEKPAMIIAGKEDQFIPIQTSRKMHMFSPRSALFEVDNAGHMVMMENPQLTADALMQLAAQES
jgi:pimeloyl-ACP methyl ester carboxylesterase